MHFLKICGLLSVLMLNAMVEECNAMQVYVIPKPGQSCKSCMYPTIPSRHSCSVAAKALGLKFHGTVGGSNEELLSAQRGCITMNWSASPRHGDVWWNPRGMEQKNIAFKHAFSVCLPCIYRPSCHC